MALREQSWLVVTRHVDAPRDGTGGAVLFRRGAEPGAARRAVPISPPLLVETPRYDA